MIRHCVRKEILENLISLRFVLSLLLIILLFAISAFVFASQYRQELNDYRNEANKSVSAFRECTGSLSDLAFHEQTIWRKPQTLAFCADGFEESLPNVFKMDVFEITRPEVKSRTSFLLPHFIDIDWVFIVSVILSFAALLLTYDGFCGEREAGTLRLILSGSIPRHKILLGKYVGAMLTLGIPLLIGLFLNLIILTSSSVVVIGSDEWPRVLAVILLSILYLSIFALLGMFVSSRMAYSANSMVILLLLWVGSVILIPGLGKIFSATSGEMPSETELARRIREAENQIHENREKYGAKASIVDERGRYINPKATARLFNSITESRNRIFEDYMNLMIAQVHTGRRFVRISPTGTYQSASETIAGTGVSRFWRLYRQLRVYQETLREWVLSIDQKDPDSHHALFDRQGDGRPYISQKPIDFNIVPKFQEPNPTFSASLRLAIWDIGVLLLWNLGFFAATWVSFMRYDVR
ncbi:MAG: ABC transporter permease subunit [Candidatus Hydrogenedentota bacterium]|nr:MAG: ABC transporter permease subunit [Candidatus Hydrogenedentota bacterium]